LTLTTEIRSWAMVSQHSKEETTHHVHALYI
jgi:hypothetical protein